jgi:hypothetical protein
MPLAKIQYSVSTLEREIVFCHLEDQVMRLPPRKITYPEGTSECQGILPNQHQSRLPHSKPLMLGKKGL